MRNVGIANVTCLFQFVVYTLDMRGQVDAGYGLATFGTLGGFVVMHGIDMPTKRAHGKFFLTMRAKLPNLLMDLPHMSIKVIYTYVLFTIRAFCLLSQVDALHMVVQQLLGLKLFLTIGAFEVPDLFMTKFHVVVKVLVLFVAYVAC